MDTNEERIMEAERRAMEAESSIAVLHDSAVEEWNILFESIWKLAVSYKDSKTFQSSKMGALFRAWNQSAATKEVMPPERPTRFDMPGIDGKAFKSYEEL